MGPRRPGFPLKKKNMVLKHFILPEMHFKANLFFPIMTPLTHPTTQPRDYRGGESKRGEWGLIKVKNKLTLKFILSDLKHFLDHVFGSLNRRFH